MDGLLHLDDERPDEPRDEKKGVWGLAAAIIGILAVAAALYYFVFMRKPAAPAATAPATETVAPAEKAAAPAGATGEPLAFPAIGLGESDAAVRAFAAALSTHPDFAKWLLTKDLVRKFVVSVDNIANGLSPKPHIDFFAPNGNFGVLRTREGTIVDAASYARYDAVVGVAQSLDAATAARLYRAAKPLIQEAYTELGYPDVDFDETLVQAMAELLGTPVVDGPIRLEQKVLSYRMKDATLEALSQAQKQFLRLGPKGVRTVHDKIKELALALGIPASRLPPAKTYATAAR